MALSLKKRGELYHVAHPQNVANPYYVSVTKPPENYNNNNLI
jgi:hypothetical protein